MQRYFAIDKNDKNIILSDNDYYHIKKVMRMKNKDNIQVVYNNTLFLATIDDIDNNKISIVNELEHKKDNYPYTRLIIPMLKEQKIDLILQKSTEIGVNEIIIVPFNRSVVKFQGNKEKSKLERWGKILKEASEQSMRIDVPLIDIKQNMDFIKDIDGYKFVCSTNEKEKNIKNVLKNINQYDKITLVIGPEGGITDNEEAYFLKNGFEKITLGNQILRVETVPMFLMSVIKYEYME